MDTESTLKKLADHLPTASDQVVAVKCIIDSGVREKASATVAKIIAAKAQLEYGMQGVIGPRKNWKDKLLDTATWHMVQSVANKTLLAMRDDISISALAATLEAALLVADVVKSTYNIELDTEAITLARESLQKAKLGIWEAKFILGVNRFTDDPVKLRKFALTMEQEQGLCSGSWVTVACMLRVIDCL